MTPAKRRQSLRLPRSAPRPWLRSDRPVPRRVVAPLDRFLRQEVGSGSLLLAAALVALAWSNVSTESYEDFWTTGVSADLGELSLHEDLRHVVNDLLMAVFFFVVALEVKREFRFGSLRDRATAAVPIAAALGTMVGAAVVYLVVNLDGGVTEGWAIPIATDIAFALSVLGVAGRRAPPELRAFMLTLAVVDDLGTIAVIAVFFSDGIELAWLAGGAAVIGVIVAMQRIGIRHLVAYVIAAGLLWIAVFESGVHATIAGVILGFLTPATSFYRRQPAAEVIATQLKEIGDRSNVEVSSATMAEVSRVSREAVSPLARMEDLLHPWSAFVVLPLFALANAGVPVSIDGIGDALTGQVGLGIVLGLLVGAPLAGFAFAWTLARSTAARLPDGLDWRAIAAVAPLKGIGFTVAIFISLLAFDSPERQEEAKLAILVASALAALVGLLALTIRHRLAGEAGVN
jgi:Na+:H+ antiporter, NhaA family